MIFTIFQRAVQSMVDGLTHNQSVGGSSPLGATNLLTDTPFNREWSDKRVYLETLKPTLQVSIPLVEFGFFYFC